MAITPREIYSQNISTRLGEGMVGYRPSAGVTRLPLVRAGSHRARMKQYVVKESGGQMMTYQCDGWVDKRL